MIIILGKNSTYNLDQDFPMFNIPTGMDGATTQSLSDFQWWAYSSDFQKWLKENPREWTADSEDMSKYGSLESFIKENFGYSEISYSENSQVLPFEEYSELSLLEQEKENSSGQILKIHYAYNMLLSEGKIKKQFIVSEQSEGEEKAVFLTLDDENGEEIMQSLAAYKMTELPTSENSKMALFKVTEMLPGGKISEDATSQTILDKTVAIMAQGALISGVALIGFYILSGIAGSMFTYRLAQKTLQKLVPAKAGSKVAALRKIAKRNKAVKGLLGKVNPSKLVKRVGKSAQTAGKFYSGVGSAFAKGSKWFKQSRRMKGTVTQALKAFARGTAKGLGKIAPKAAVDWIPIVGWALAAIDVVGSTWNWFSDKQAPLYSDVKSFAKDKFSPKQIPIGVPITICWSQEAGGAWGNIVNFLANNDTRTTMELVKIGDIDGKSIFILTQINSKEMGKQLAEHDLTLISFDSTEEVKTGLIDNDDLDFEIATIDGIEKLSVLFNFKGIIDWDQAVLAYNDSSDQIFISDSEAPKNYKFHFEDSEGERINVSGKLMTDEQISQLSDSELSGYFALNTETNESLEYEWDKQILESENILSFDAFSNKAFEINEEESGEDDMMGDLKPSQKTGPQKLAIYKVEEKQYANPELRGKFKIGDFKDFVVNPEFWEAEDGSKIEVLVDTDDILEDPIKGVYTYKEEVDDTETSQGEAPPSPERREDDEEEGQNLPDDYYITTSPDDVRIKTKERSTTIRDFDYSGGLNLFDKFLTPRQKEILGIDLWKTITFAKEFYDRRGDIIEVKLKNKYAPFGERTKKYRVTDGEAFEIAKKFVEDTKERIKYE